MKTKAAKPAAPAAKKGISKGIKIALAVASLLAVVFVVLIVIRKSAFRFVDVHDSRYLGDQYDFFKGATISSKYNGLTAEAKAVIQTNGKTLFFPGDVVKVQFADVRAGASFEAEVLETPKRNLILVDHPPVGSGSGPWSGTIELV